jgi:hypothetical protein
MKKSLSLTPCFSWLYDSARNQKPFQPEFCIRRKFKPVARNYFVAEFSLPLLRAKPEERAGERRFLRAKKAPLSVSLPVRSSRGERDRIMPNAKSGF